MFKPAVNSAPHIIDTNEILLPFLDRPEEVEELIFKTPCNASLAKRLSALFDAQDATGMELRQILVATSREELGDARWVRQLRALLQTLKPGLWPELEHTLGAEGLSRSDDSTCHASTSSSPNTSIRMGNSQRKSADATPSSSTPQPAATAQPALAWPSMSASEEDDDKTPMSASQPAVASRGYFISEDGTPVVSTGSGAPTEPKKPVSVVQGHRHQPSFGATDHPNRSTHSAAKGLPDAISLRDIKPAPIRKDSSNNAAGVSTPSAEKQLRASRPLGTPVVDDTELLSPQKSKYSFARTFEGPTLANAREGMRPKAYSMTQYSSNVEQVRLDRGRGGDISPCELAARLEEQGEEKPASLGVLEDGRTKHPFAVVKKNPLSVAALHPAVGLTPATKMQRSSSFQSIDEAEDGDDEQVQEDGSASAKPTPHLGVQAAPLRPAVEALPHLQIPYALETKPRLSQVLDDHCSTEAHSQDSPTIRPFRSAGGSGFALGGGFFKPLSSHSRRASTSSSSSATGSTLSPQRTGERKEVSWSPQIYRRPGGFSSFSRDLTSAKHGRSRSESGASAMSTGSQAIASSEGTPVSDYFASFEDDDGLDTPELDTVDDSDDECFDGFVRPKKLDRRIPAGDLGLDFGDGINEESTDVFSGSSAASSSSANSPISPIFSPPTGGQSTPRRRRSQDTVTPPLSPRGLRSKDHIIIPVSPGAERSRTEVMASLVNNARFESISRRARSAIGPESWDKATHYLSHAERQEVNDKQLLEYLAVECFRLVDLDSHDRKEREKAEEVVCEDLEAYTKRWEAFHDVLDGLGVPPSSIKEAERRCAPGSILY